MSEEPVDLDTHLPSITRGDDVAFGRWLAGAEAPLRRSLTRFAGSVDVEAILQETLLRVWQVAPRIEIDGRANGLLRFALTAARNLAISEARRHRPDTDYELALAEEGVVEVSEPDPLLRAAIEDCREELPRKPSEALAARLETAGVVSDHELAARVGMKTNTFLKNFSRARKQLADCLSRAGVNLRVEMP